MGKALSNEAETRQTARPAVDSTRSVDWPGKVSDHVAWGLLVYTGLHIFMTMTQLKGGGGSLLPYFALVILVVAIIPAARAVEMRWAKLAERHDDAQLASLYRRDMALVWLAAIGLPVALTIGSKLVRGAF